MSDQPEALRLADALDNLYVYGLKGAAATELRRLHKVETDFHMDYRMKCDAELKKLEAERDAAVRALFQAQEAAKFQVQESAKTLAFASECFAIATKDAERYRWLRDTLHGAKAGGGLTVNEALQFYENPVSGEEVCIYWYSHTPTGHYEQMGSTLDAAIDAAIDATKENK